MDTVFGVDRDSAVSRLNLAVSWVSPIEHPRPVTATSLEVIAPSAEEIAALFLGIEQAYRLMSLSLGYPPHFVKVVSLRNPELKLSLEGGKDAIDALRELIFALPRFVASLFKPGQAKELARLEAEATKRVLEAKAATGAADAAEAEARRLRAELQAAELRQSLGSMPIHADAETHALLRDLVKHIQEAAAPRRGAFIADTAKYLATTRAYEPSSRIALVAMEESAYLAGPEPRAGRISSEEVGPRWKEP